MKRKPSVDLQEVIEIEVSNKNHLRFMNSKNIIDHPIDDILLIYLDIGNGINFLDDSKLRYYSVLNNSSDTSISIETNLKNDILKSIAQKRRKIYEFPNDGNLEKVYPMKKEENWNKIGNMHWEDNSNYNTIDQNSNNNTIDQNSNNTIDQNTNNNTIDQNSNHKTIEVKDNSYIQEITHLNDKTNNSDSEIEYLELDEQTKEVKRNINIIKKEIRKVESRENKNEMLFFIDKCIECKNNITDIFLDIKLCPNTYNVNLGSRIYSLMKVDHNSELTIFDVLQSLCVLSEDLPEFMKNYKVLQITGIIIHPLTKVKEVSPIDKYVIVTNIKNIDLGIDSQFKRNRNILGLRNLGNTCFMNSSLQAIINCKEFSDYFYSLLNEDKKLSFSFSQLVKNFDNKSDYIVPHNFRNVIGSKRNIYMENNEQDAMEFITDFLDIIHEELKIKKRSKSENIDGYQKWQIENQSLVTNLFFIKLKSSIVCSECTNSRSIYEPCLYLPVPVPLKKKFFDEIIIFYDSSNKVPLKIFADENFTIYELKEFIKLEYFVKTENIKSEILCCQVNNNNMTEIDDFTILKNIKGPLFCYEYDKDKIQEYFWIKISKKYFFWTTYLDFWILGRNCNNKKDKELILNILSLKLTPLLNTTRSNSFYESLASIIHIEYEKKTTDHLSTNISNLSSNSLSNTDQTVTNTDHLSTNTDHLSTNTGHSLTNTGHPLTNTGHLLRNRPQVKISLSHSNFTKLFGYNFNPIKDMVHCISDKADLKNCINSFLEREYIFGDDKQLCDGCNNYTLHFKDTELERLPKYLIIQLKRFRFTGIDFEKIDTFVDFDLGVFNIKDTQYKVISVINHIAPSTGYAFRSVGSNGHYTSYVRYQDEWYLCNDESVSKVSDIKKEDAYVFVLEKLD